MTVAERKKKEHIVDHVLYCWQLEDLIRAAQFQPNVLQQWAGQQAESEGTDPEEEEKFLLRMAHSLRDSGAVEQGHSSEVQETLMELAHLHELLLGAMADAEYKGAYEAAAPILKELSAKSSKEVHPVEQMVIGLYGWLVLRMKKEAVSAETESAMVGLRNWANALARGYVRVYFGM
ncbi:MAG: DUF4924 family protein [Flavobacteriales bacterium]